MHAWGLILGVLSPLLISVVQQPQWSSRTRTAVGVAAALVIGVLTVLADGGADLTDWLSTLATVLVASQAAYLGIFRPPGIAYKIENVTAIGKRRGQHSTPYDENTHRAA